MVDGYRLTISTGCLNRTDFLRKSLTTWLKASEPDEIVVVDWNNKVPLEETLSEFKDSRVVFVRVTDQPTWKNSKCHNLEVELASGDLMLRLDSDYLLKDTFFAKHPVARGRFYAGNWKPWTGDVEKCSLAGTLYAFRSDIVRVNGYNERLVYYGCEDDDLFDRMAATGLTRIDVDFSTLEHIFHSDKMRYENLEVANDLPKLAEHNLLYDESLKKLHLVDRNRILASKKPWSSADYRTSWRIDSYSDKNTGSKRFKCVETVRTMAPPANGDVVFTEEANELIPLIRSITPTKNYSSSASPVPGEVILNLDLQPSQVFALLYRAVKQAHNEVPCSEQDTKQSS